MPMTPEQKRRKKALFAASGDADVRDYDRQELSNMIQEQSGRLRTTMQRKKLLDGPAVAEDEEGLPAPPEEEAQFSQIDTRILQYIYTPNGDINPKLLPQLADPEAIGTVAATLLQGIRQQASDAGDEIYPDVVVAGGTRILERLAEAAELAGYEMSDDDLATAMMTATVEMLKPQLADKESLRKVGGEAMNTFRSQLAEEDASGMIDDETRKALSGAGIL